MAAFGFVFWVIVARLYQPAQLGVASTLISSMNFIAYLSLLGFNSTFVRFLPQSRNRDEHINTGLILVTGAALLSGGLFAVLAPLFAPKLGILHQSIWFELGFVALCVGAAVNLVTDSIFVAYRAAGYNLLVDGLLASSIQLLLPAVLIGLGAYGIYAAQGSAVFVAMLVSLLFLIKKFQYRPALKLNHQVWQEVKQYSFGNYAGNLFNTLPSILVPIIVLNKLGAAPAGYYYLAFMMANLLFAIAYGVTQSLFAEGSYEERQLWLLVKRAAALLAVLVIPASLILVVVGPFILDVFGRNYGLHARQVLLVLAAAAPFTAACALGTVTLRITKHVGSILLINVFYALIICGLAFAWAPRGLAWVGGAWLSGQVLTAVIIFAVLGFQHRRHWNARRLA